MCATNSLNLSLEEAEYIDNVACNIEYAYLKFTVNGRSKHTYTHVSNAVPLVWDSPRLTPMKWLQWQLLLVWLFSVTTHHDGLYRWPYLWSGQPEFSTRSALLLQPMRQTVREKTLLSMKNWKQLNNVFQFGSIGNSKINTSFVAFQQWDQALNLIGSVEQSGTRGIHLQIAFTKMGSSNQLLLRVNQDIKMTSERQKSREHWY